MRRNPIAAALIGVLFLGCATVAYSNYRPDALVSATVGNPIIDVGISTAGPVVHRQLLYGGLSGDTIKMTYREFQLGHALGGPLVTQDLQFDLSKSRVIACQEMRLEVVNG